MSKVSLKNIHAKFNVRNSPQSPNIWQNSDGCISDFQISDQSLINKNCHNYRTTNDISMKLRSITKLDKRNPSMSNKFHDDVMLANCDVIVIFLIYDQFGAIRKPDYARMICKAYIFINSNLLSYKI